MHRVPAGFPRGMPGIGLDIEGAMQQAPQFGRQFMIPRKRLPRFSHERRSSIRHVFEFLNHAIELRVVESIFSGDDE